MKLKTRDFIFVAIQLGLFVVYLLDVQYLMFESVIVVNYIGLAISIIGGLVLIIALLQLNKNLSPFPSPKFNTQLIQNGLYRYIRHPIYTAILLITFGFGLYIGSLFKILISLGLYILFYYKSLYEEQRLAVLFPKYTEYKKKTARFIPKTAKY